MSMNMTAWMLAGTAIGWVCFSYLRFNPNRGPVISIIIGVAGGLLGGAWLAPLLETVPLNPGEFNPLSFFMASAVSLAFVIVADLVHKRFGV